MAITTTLQKVEALYIGYFGRAGDPDGTSYWTNKLNSGFSLVDAAASFSVQAEAKAAYPFLANPTLVSPTDFVTQVYQNLFNRAPDDAGKAYWVAELTANQGNPAYVGNFILAVINGAYGAGGSATDVATIENKVAAGSYFTEVAATKAVVLTETKPDGTVVLTAEGKLLTSAAVGPAVTSDPKTVTAANEATDALKPLKLTTGVDTLVGTAINDTFDASEIGAVATLSNNDSLDGGAGIDTLKIVQAGAINTTGVTGLSIKNIEIANLTSSTGGVTTNTTAWAGLTNLNSTSVGSANLVAAATTDVKATVTAAGGLGAVSVTGGNNVTVSASAAGNGGTIDVDGAAGDVVVNSSNASIGGSASVTVTGGKTITVTESVTTDKGLTAIHGNVSVNGGATTTAVTVNQDKAATANADVVGKTNGSVTITDGNATTASDTIKTVTLANFSGATIASSVLDTLNLSGGDSQALASGAVVLNKTAGDTSVAATTLNLNMAGGFVGAINGDQAAAYTTVNVASAANATIADASFTANKTLNVSGAGVTTFTALTAGNNTALTAINSTGGGLTIGTQLADNVAVTGGAGVETVSIGATTKVIDLGAGNDKVISSGLVGTGGSVNAGDGIDTIVMTSAEAAVAGSSLVFNSKFTNFEVLELSNQLAAGTTLNLAGINNVSTVVLTAGAGSTTSVISNLASNGTVRMTANSAGLEVKVKDAAAGLNDVLNIDLSGVSALNTATIKAGGVETVNFKLFDADTTTTSAAVIHQATLDLADATTLTVSGNNGLTITNTTGSKITTFDASGVVANSTATVIDSAANLAVTFASNNTEVAAVVSITGGAGNDELTGNDAKDTIIGGAGNDTITGGKGIDTLTGGAGSDTFKFAAGDAGITGTETITDFSIALGGDTLDLATVALIADKAAFSVAGAVGGAVELLATVKDGYITLSGADAGLVTSIGQIKAIFELLDADNTAEVGAIALNGHTYVLTDAASGAGADSVNDIIQLAGVSGVTSMSTTDAANSIWIA